MPQWFSGRSEMLRCQAPPHQTGFGEAGENAPSPGGTARSAWASSGAFDEAQQTIAAFFEFDGEFLEVFGAGGFAFDPGAALAVVEFGMIALAWFEGVFEAQG